MLLHFWLVSSETMGRTSLKSWCWARLPSQRRLFYGGASRKQLDGPWTSQLAVDSPSFAW
jgi:hypothetical protein